MILTFRRATGVAAFALCAAPWLLPAQSGFEGVMTFVTRDGYGKKADTLMQTVKGRNMRMESIGERKGGGGSMIVDSDKKRLIMIDDKEKTAMIMSQDDGQKAKEVVDGMAKSMPKGRPPAAPPTARVASDFTITNTGRTETVAGVRCEVYRGTSNNTERDREGEVCIADGVGFALFGGMTGNTMFQSQSRGVSDFGSVMRAGKGLVKSTTTEKGKTYVALELIKVDRKSVPASTFEPPAGYQVRTMADMMSQMGGAMQQLQEQMKARKKPPQ